MKNPLKKEKKFLLIDLLQSFNNKEKERFTYFITSTYFNTDQSVVKLFKALKKNVLSRKPFDDAAQIQVYQATFSNLSLPKNVLTKQQKKVLGAIMSKLTKLAQRFLIIEHLEQYPTFEMKILNEQLLEKKQFNLFNRLLKKNQKQLDSQLEKGIEHYAFGFELEMERMNYLYQKGLLIKENNFPALIDNLDKYYLLNKLKLWLTIQSIANVSTKNSYDFTSFEAIKSLLDHSEHSNNRLILLYRIVIQLLDTKKEADYFYLVKLLEQYGLDIPRNYLVDFYTVACNFCMHQVRIGQIDYNRKLFELYKVIDAKGLLLEGDYLQLIKFKNIIGASCHVDEFEWAIKMVHKYYIYTAKEVQKSIYHFNLGTIEFYKSNYKEAISHFIRVEKIDLAYDLDCRMMLLKSYYEIDKQYDERTMQIFRSAERFIETNQELTYAPKKSYKNFIQILINLYRVRHKEGKTTIKGVENKLEKMAYVSDKKWLVDKIENLSKGN